MQAFYIFDEDNRDNGGNNIRRSSKALSEVSETGQEMNVRSTISFFFKFFHQQQLSHYQRRVHSSIHVEEVMCWRKIMLSFPPEVETLQASVREVRSTF